MYPTASDGIVVISSVCTLFIDSLLSCMGWDLCPGWVFDIFVCVFHMFWVELEFPVIWDPAKILDMF